MTSAALIFYLQMLTFKVIKLQYDAEADNTGVQAQDLNSKKVQVDLDVTFENAHKENTMSQCLTRLVHSLQVATVIDSRRSLSGALSCHYFCIWGTSRAGRKLHFGIGTPFWHAVTSGCVVCNLQKNKAIITLLTKAFHWFFWMWVLPLLSGQS